MKAGVRREYVPETRRNDVHHDVDNRPWWQICGVEEFRQRAAELTRVEQERLASEIAGAKSIVVAQLESRGRVDLGWWRGARAALGFITEKHRIIAAELQVRNATDQQHKKKGKSARALAHIEELIAARALAEAGDVRGALLRFLDYEIAFRQRDAEKETP